MLYFTKHVKNSTHFTELGEWNKVIHLCFIQPGHIASHLKIKSCILLSLKAGQTRKGHIWAMSPDCLPPECSFTDPAISMDLLRAVLQPSINEEIQTVFNKYMKVRGTQRENINREKDSWAILYCIAISLAYSTTHRFLKFSNSQHPRTYFPLWG